MKKFLYHKVPPNMTGDTLFPLNQMKELLPHIYEAQVKKYNWRPHIPMQIIPQLNCLWNDVIFLFAVHPRIVNGAITRAGLMPLKLSYYEIPFERVDQSNISVWSCIKENGKYLEEFESFDIHQFERYRTLGKGSNEYFQEMKITSPDRYLVYLTVPHVLYKGTINIQGLNIVTL